jgi:HlyD family secretion protein
MDIPRPDNLRRKRIRQIGFGTAAAVAVLLATVALARLEPAAPNVARASVWVDTVRQGELVRQVRGPGTLVPREVRWIAAQTDGRVERILVRPGAVVEPDTIIVELSNPDLVQQTEEASFALQAAEAEFIEAELRLRAMQLDQRAAMAVARAEYEGARLQAEAEQSLAERGIVPSIQYRRTELLTEQLKIRLDIEGERLEQFATSMEAQIASQRAQLEQVRNRYQRRLAQVDSLQVRAGIGGVLQQVPVEIGQRVTLGANLARVARPDELMAELRVAETQARDVAIGQSVKVDTRNGIVDGHVVRIDPAVQSGTVQVDVELTGPLPRGARPDLSVDGTIELERLPNVVYTGRPAYGQPNSTISLFKLTDGGRTAVRVPVQLGRSSVNAIEILQGLEPGEQVILSDTSTWDSHQRIRLN